jgi:hypothetical protein
MSRELKKTLLSKFTNVFPGRLIHTSSKLENVTGGNRQSLHLDIYNRYSISVSFSFNYFKLLKSFLRAKEHLLMLIRPLFQEKERKIHTSVNLYPDLPKSFERTLMTTIILSLFLKRYLHGKDLLLV